MSNAAFPNYTDRVLVYEQGSRAVDIVAVSSHGEFETSPTMTLGCRPPGSTYVQSPEHWSCPLGCWEDEDR